MNMKVKVKIKSRKCVKEGHSKLEKKNVRLHEGKKSESQTKDKEYMMLHQARMYVHPRSSSIEGAFMPYKPKNKINKKDKKK